MKKFSMRILMMSAAAVVSGALALEQNRPMGSSQTQVPTNPNNQSSSASPDQMQQQEDGMLGSMQDKDFVKSALEGGMAEVKMGQLAAQKGSSDGVKQFGQKMVQDHTQMGDQMKQVAQQIGVKEPKGLSKKDQANFAKLDALSGDQFDNAYIQMMVKDHKKDLSDFQQEAQNTQDPDLKQVAQQGSQIIDQHLQMIEQIAKSNQRASK